VQKITVWCFLTKLLNPQSHLEREFYLFHAICPRKTILHRYFHSSSTVFPYLVSNCSWNVPNMRLLYVRPSFHFRRPYYWWIILSKRLHLQRSAYHFHSFYLEGNILRIRSDSTMCTYLFLAWHLCTSHLHKYFHFWRNTCLDRVFCRYKFILNRYHHRLLSFPLKITKYLLLSSIRRLLLVGSEAAIR